MHKCTQCTKTQKGTEKGIWKEQIGKMHVQLFSATAFLRLYRRENEVAGKDVLRMERAGNMSIFSW